MVIISLKKKNVGKLIYLTLTRPDITYEVNVVGQFMHALTSAHFADVERILCYLNNNERAFFILNKILFL